MCIFGRAKSPTPPPPLPPAPVPPSPPPVPGPLPEEEVRPVNPAVREAQTKLGTKKGKKGSTGDLRIKKQVATTGVTSTINPGNTSKTGGLQGGNP